MANEQSPDAARARAELAATLDEIEAKVNVPKRLKGRLSEVRSNPKLMGAVAAAAAAVLGGVGWLVVRGIRR